MGLVGLRLDLMTDHPPSVLWHCWLGHITCKKYRPRMTYTVSSGTLNPTLLLLLLLAQRSIKRLLCHAADLAVCAESSVCYTVYLSLNCMHFFLATFDVGFVLWTRQVFDSVAQYSPVTASVGEFSRDIWWPWWRRPVTWRAQQDCRCNCLL